MGEWLQDFYEGFVTSEGIWFWGVGGTWLVLLLFLIIFRLWLASGDRGTAKLQRWSSIGCVIAVLILFAVSNLEVQTRGINVRLAYLVRASEVHPWAGRPLLCKLDHPVCEEENRTHEIEPLSDELLCAAIEQARTILTTRALPDLRSNLRKKIDENFSAEAMLPRIDQLTRKSPKSNVLAEAHPWSGRIALYVETIQAQSVALGIDDDEEAFTWFLGLQLLHESAHLGYVGGGFRIIPVPGELVGADRPEFLHYELNLWMADVALAAR
ncbi:MAG: hypothetical protein GY711_19315 [bacterium]|nr:hypothetical protein [bacterium]